MWSVGRGTGQAAAALASFFDQVIGTELPSPIIANVPSAARLKSREDAPTPALVPFVSSASMTSPLMDLIPSPRLPTPLALFLDCYPIHWLSNPGSSPVKFDVLKGAEHEDACHLKPNGIWEAFSNQYIDY